MKNLVFGLIATVLLISPSYAQNDLIFKATEISKNEKFIKLIENLNIFTESPKDFKLVNELGLKDKLNLEEQSQLLLGLGFKSQNEAFNFDMENFELIKAIYNDFDLNRLTKVELTYLFELAITNIPNYSLVEKRTCSQILSSCNTGAWGVYILEHAGCASAGIGIGALSFWCAGCVGAGVWSACATGATMHMSSMLATCRDNYDDCRG
jgi:hypothetical protein